MILGAEPTQKNLDKMVVIYMQKLTAHRETRIRGRVIVLSRWRDASGLVYKGFWGKQKFGPGGTGTQA